uniref:RNA-directed DNA polymerase n=1 Tax=Sipha flava TaxID=143950 RepID=A0A2S2QHF4_9HEMI
MSFFRTISKINSDYHINNVKLVEIDTYQDLGVVFQPNLLFSSNIKYLCSKALRSLGFLIRNTKEFNNETCLKILYTSLVRPILEFSSVLWNPAQVGLVESLERVQRKFLRFVGYKRKLNGHLNPSVAMSLSSIQASINLESLATRRKSIDIRFMIKLINGVISCPDLLNSLNFNVPKYNSRHRPTFSIPFHRTSYGYNNPLDRIARECNELNNFDLFHSLDFQPLSKVS